MTTTLYAADRTALLIVDPYNDFVSEGGKFYAATREAADAVLTTEELLALLPATIDRGPAQHAFARQTA